MTFTESLPLFLADFGVPCTSGGHAFTGILDQPDELFSQTGINVQSTMRTLIAQTSDVAAAGIVHSSAVTVEGSAFVVREAMQLDDGAFSRLTLSQ